MHRILLAALVLVPFSIRSQVVVGYVYGKNPAYSHDSIEYNCLTHIAHAFLIPDSNGSFHYPDWFLYPELVRTAHYNGKKIVVSLGGWGNSAGFKPMAADPLKRKKFIRELTDFIKLHNYDGADIDWEYPAAEDKENFTALITEIRDAFDNEGIEILSAALPAIDWHNVFDIERLKEKFTWFGIMTYDFYGPWEKSTGLNTALYSTPEQFLSVDSSMKHYLAKGVPPEKLCMGMEFAGYQFNAPGLYKMHQGGKSITYLKSLEKVRQGWNVNWHSGAKVPYLTFQDSIITIDDTSSIRYKTDYIVNNNLAGTIIWKLGLDFRNGYNEFLNIIGRHYLDVLPAKPQILSPQNNSHISNPDLDVQWDYAKAAGKYLFELSESENFNNILFSSYTDSPGIKLTNLLAEKIYYFRVRSENLGGISDWSEIKRFSTIKPDAMTSDRISLSYFPKNFNEEVNLYYQLPGDMNIIIKMYNELGREIKVQENKKLRRGNYLMKTDLSAFPQGNYYFLLYSEDGIKKIRLSTLKVNHY
jgi:chitinase